MKIAVLVAVVLVTTLSAIETSRAELTPDQLHQVEAFSAGVRALDPHTEDSEPALQALVEKYVPDAGRIQVFLDFMTASGFECPPITSLATGANKLPEFACKYEPDLGPTGKPNWSSVTEQALFYVIAHCDEKKYIMTVEGLMMHGFLGP